MPEPQKFTIVLFQLPDGRYILQRRTADAPYAPGKLGIFGGWVEKGESPDECIIREIEEETNLKTDTLSIRLVKDFVLPAGEDFSEDRHFFFYTAQVPNVDFEVYEGQGAEAFSLNELKTRNDLTGSAAFTIKYQL